MRKTTKSPGKKIVKDIKPATRKQQASEKKIRIVLDGLRGNHQSQPFGAVSLSHAPFIGPFLT